MLGLRKCDARRFGVFGGGSVVGLVLLLMCGCAGGGNGGGDGRGGVEVGVSDTGSREPVRGAEPVDATGRDGGDRNGGVVANRPMRLSDSEVVVADRGTAGGTGSGAGSEPVRAPVVTSPSPAPAPAPAPVPVVEPDPEPAVSAAEVWRPAWWHESATWSGDRIAVCRFADAADMLQARTEAIYACLDAIESAGGDRSNVVVERADTQRQDGGLFRMFVRVTAPRVNAE